MSFRLVISNPTLPENTDGYEIKIHHALGYDQKTYTDQFYLALEDLETAMAEIHAEDEADAPVGSRVTKPRAINRGSLTKHLPRVEEVIEPESLVCPTCNHTSSRIIRFVPDAACATRDIMESKSGYSCCIGLRHLHVGITR